MRALTNSCKIVLYPQTPIHLMRMSLLTLHNVTINSKVSFVFRRFLINSPTITNIAVFERFFRYRLRVNINEYQTALAYIFENQHCIYASDYHIYATYVLRKTMFLTFRVLIILNEFQQVVPAVDSGYCGLKPNKLKKKIKSVFDIHAVSETDTSYHDISCIIHQ